jgi:hypothetical protein
MDTLLGVPIDINKYDDVMEVFEEAHALFSEQIINRDNRPKLFGRFIYFDETKKIQDKEDSYWHIASIGEDDYKYDMYPCQNHIAQMRCKFQCNSDHPDNFLRSYNSIPCLFRAHKINWIKNIIDLANQDSNHPNLKIWKKEHKKPREKRLFIRYLNPPIDYVLIFTIVYTPNKNDIKYYKFITAYPVVLKSYKRQFDKDYERYLQKK